MPSTTSNDKKPNLPSSRSRRNILAALSRSRPAAKTRHFSSVRAKIIFTTALPMSPVAPVTNTFLPSKACQGSGQRAADLMSSS
jgi:hypothetical protein